MKSEFRSKGLWPVTHRLPAQPGRMQRGTAAGVILILSGSLWLGIIHLARLVVG